MAKFIKSITEEQYNERVDSEINAVYGECISNIIYNFMHESGIEDITLAKIMLAKDSNDEHFLKLLSKDPDWRVRKSVAEKEDIDDDLLDFFAKDENCFVRKAVAEHGRDKDLNILVNDPDAFVRCAVAEHGRYQDLKVLENDENSLVREVVKRFKKGEKIRDLAKLLILEMHGGYDDFINNLAR